MKRILAGLTALAALLVVVPALLGRGCAGVMGRSDAAGVPGDLPVILYVPEEKRLVSLPLSQYLIGVVAAEMPPGFETEALKAQMVAARTYTVRRMRKFGGAGCPLDPLADVCGSPDLDQAFISPDQLQDKLGVLAAYRYRERLIEAEMATRGLILTYSGTPIDAQYHATSGGYTEDAAAVWGNALPYLQPVPDPYGQAAPRYTEQVSLGGAEVMRMLGLPSTALAHGTGVPRVTILDRTPGKRVARVQVGGVTFSGTDVRKRLGLRSTDFDIETAGDKLLITTRGYGHGLGLSQWGANGMAQNGYEYQKILIHYYRGVRLERIFSEEAG